MHMFRQGASSCRSTTRLSDVQRHMQYTTFCFRSQLSSRRSASSLLQARRFRLRLIDDHRHKSRALVRHLISSSFLPSDTIFALATPNGYSAIAIIRISGPAALLIFSKLCPGSEPPKVRRAHIQPLYAPRPTDSDRRHEIIDPSAVILYFAAPRSSTGQDVIELHVHGGRAVVSAVLQAIASCSTSEQRVRHADPGEFTKRAFLSGRLNLAQAEALGALLAAETEQQRRAAVIGSSSALGEQYDQWQKLLTNARGELEALIDFAEDQQFDEAPELLISNVLGRVKTLQAILFHHLQNAVKGELLRNGIRLTILGRPNVGKSSLLNALSNREAAIVSSQAGTTRDVVEVSLNIDGYLVRLADTAGLRSGYDNDCQEQEVLDLDKVEIEGMRRALTHAQASNVVLLVIEAELTSQGYPCAHVCEKILEAARQCVANDTRMVVAVNKVDLLPNKAAVDRLLEATKRHLSNELTGLIDQACLKNIPIVPVSCIPSTSVVGASLESNLSQLVSSLSSTFTSLTQAIDIGSCNSSFLGPSQTIWQESLGATERQRALLQGCVTNLEQFINLCQLRHESDSELDVVLAAERLRNAASCLASITGHGANDVEQVLGVVFEKFCVGK